MQSLNRVLGRFSVAKKISALVGLLIVLTLVVGAVAVVSTQRIGTQLDMVADRATPLANTIADLETLQAQRSLQVQRALRHGTAYATMADPESLERLEDAISRFREYGRQYDERTLRAREALNGLAASDADGADLWTSALQRLDAVEAARASYGESAAVLFDQLQERQAIAARQTMNGMEVQVGAISDEITAITGVVREQVAHAADEAQALEREAFFSVITIAAIGSVVALVFAFIVVRAFTGPLAGVVKALERLGEGDTNQTVETSSRDEVGRLANAYEVFRQKLIAAEEERKRAAEREAEEEERSRQALLSLAARFEERVGGVINSLTSSATEMQATSQQLSAAVEETSAQSGAVSAAAEQASTNVQTVASATEELSAAIREVSTQVSDTAGKSRHTAASAQGVRSEMSQLTSAIQEVDAIIDAISAIAEQTNLLALNATIESARAGEAGKGFAVVAGEVKELANHTKQMTEDIGQKITAVRASADKAVQAMQLIIDQVGAIDEAATAMASSVEQQTAATNEISRNAQEASTGASEVSSNIIGVQNAANQSSEATSSVRTAAEELSRQAATLKQEMDSLLTEIRAA